MHSNDISFLRVYYYYYYYRRNNVASNTRIASLIISQWQRLRSGFFSFCNTPTHQDIYSKINHRQARDFDNSTE